MKFNTKVIHSGQKPEKQFGAVIPPIYQTSTFIQQAPGVFKGYDYTRAGNPNFANLEEALASLENARKAVVFSSGLAAITALFMSFSPRIKILAEQDLYGGTKRLFNKVLLRHGYHFKYVDLTDATKLERLIKKREFGAVLLETPTNPLLRIIDIKKISVLAKKYGLTFIVDNTFTSPYLQQPLALGADAAVYSTTKYIGGHSDIIGGAIVTNNLKLAEKLKFLRKAMGFNPSPFDCWLISRGLKTLSLRMARHCANAQKVAEFLAGHKMVSKVYYPGLKSHKNYEIAKRQMKDFGGMISFELKGNERQLRRFLTSLKIFILAESLGGVESLVNHPASMTHVSMSKRELLLSGISPKLIRLSVGIEDVSDLINDLKNAFAKII